jgi:hypothetical protein
MVTLKAFNQVAELSVQLVNQLLGEPEAFAPGGRAFPAGSQPRNQ